MEHYATLPTLLDLILSGKLEGQSIKSRDLVVRRWNQKTWIELPTRLSVLSTPRTFIAVPPNFEASGSYIAPSRDCHFAQ